MEQVTYVFGTFANVAEPEIGDPANPAPIVPEAFTIDHLQNGAYSQYLIDTKYATDTGLRVIPKAASGADSSVQNSVVRIHRGLTEKEVAWTVERQNDLPDIPQLSTNDPNEIPIRQEITFANKLQMLNGNKVYRSSGVNYYRLIKPKMADSKYPIGTTPAEVSPSSANYYGPANFRGDIIDGAFAAPGGLPTVIVRVGH